MPLTRAAEKKQAMQTNENENSSVHSVNKKGTSSRVAASFMQHAGLGLKRKADGRTILGEKNMNASTSTGVRKALASRSKNVKSVPLQSKIHKKQLTPKITIPTELPNFTGHDSFTQVPLDMWRLELRQELINKNKFHDQEKVSLNNPNESPHFALGIFEYMKWREEQFQIQPYFGEAPQQTGFNENDRKVLVDWMVEFQEIQETNHETLYLAVKLADYYFSKTFVNSNNLQLVAFVSFLLASKFEERWPPTFEDMIYLSEDAYRREDFINLELDMLKVLDFDINIPTSYRYLRRFAKCIGMDMASLTCARFYLELSLIDYQFVTEKQSKMAAAALWIALSTLGYDAEKRARCQPGRVRHDKKYWCDLLSYYTGYREFEIIDLVKRLAASVRSVQAECSQLLANGTLEESGEQVPKTIYNKYVSETFFGVAICPIPSVEHIQTHETRLVSDRIDYEASLEPNVKRQSLGSAVRQNTTRLRKMTLRSSTSPEPVRALQREKAASEDENKEN